MSILTVIDVGNYSTKYAYKKNNGVSYNSFSSVIHPYKPLEFTDGITRIEYNDLDYYVGEPVKSFYVKKENRMYFGNIRKGHHEAQIRLVAALYDIYKQTGENVFNLVLTSPFSSMENDKKYFMSNFHGERTATVNGENFEFTVNNILMGAEGLGALAYIETLNCAIVDAGSMTTNILYLINGVISKEDSITLNGGTINNDIFDLATHFVKTCSYIEYDYPIITTGGKAKEMAKQISKLGYTDVIAADSGDVENYYINSVGLLKKFGDRFEELFK